MNKSTKYFNGFKVFYDKKGYAVIWVGGRNIKVHVFVWEKKNGPKPEGFEIHHIDHNKGNYSLENLQLLSRSDHQKHHAGWIKTDGLWSHKPCTKCSSILPLSCFYPRKGYTPSAQCKSCHVKTTRGWAIKNPTKAKAIKRKSYLKSREVK